MSQAGRVEFRVEVSGWVKRGEGEEGWRVECLELRDSGLGFQGC